MPDINVNKLSEALNTKADIDLNNTGVFSTSSGGVNLVQSTPSDAKGREVASADFSLKQGGLELMDVVFAPLGIDESKNKRRYLNGQVIIQEQFPAFTSAVKARMSTMANAFTTETNWQAEKTQSKLGQCGKFVVDDTAGTIRLPCVVNAQGLVDLALIGGIKSESLPNITGSAAGNRTPWSWDVCSKAFYNGGDTTTASSSYKANLDTGTSGKSSTLKFDASRSSSTYQNNAPVQQEAVQYPYCIVVNTGVEESDRPINNYQVNNVYSYGMSQYYKGTMNNNSWLKSAGQWNDGTVYTGMYNWLLEQMNAGVSGFIASTSTYTDYDFVINTANQTFRLPLLNGEEDLPSDRYDNLTISATTQRFTAPANGIYTVSGVGFGWVDIANETSGSFGSCSQPRTADGYGRYTINAKQGDKIVVYCGAVPSSYICRFIYAKGNGSLYYYVGDTLQNAQLINVARIEEKLVNFVDKTSTTDRETVVGWGIPDYTAGISFSNNTDYTAPKNGVAMCVVNLGDFDGLGDATVYINNNEVFHIAGTSAGSVRNLIYIPVSKGNIIKVYMKRTTTSSLKFYPFKGVN